MYYILWNLIQNLSYSVVTGQDRISKQKTEIKTQASRDLETVTHRSGILTEPHQQVDETLVGPWRTWPLGCIEWRNVIVRSTEYNHKNSNASASQIYCVNDSCTNAACNTVKLLCTFLNPPFIVIQILLNAQWNSLYK